MSEELIIYELREGVAHIGLNRVQKKNAMNGDLFDQLDAAVRLAHKEANAGLIYSCGEDFSSGLDLKYALSVFGKIDPIRATVSKPFDTIASGPIPFVCALRGAVIGAGFELAAAAQIRVADRGTYFALPESKRGIFVGAGGSVRIQRLVGYPVMADMMLTGRVLSAEEGERKGALQYLVDDGESVEAVAAEIAGRIAGNAPRSNWAVVNALPRIGQMSEEEGLNLESMTAKFVIAGADSGERISEFLEKKSAPLRG